MDFSKPLSSLAPSADASVLGVLAQAEASLTGRGVARATGLSLRTVQVALARLVRQGVILRETGGSAHLYRLNREHLAAPSIDALASLRLLLIDRLREALAGWRVPPAAAVLFGSIARGEESVDSDLDILIVRARGIDAENERWRAQLLELERAATAWTGNDTRILEYMERELTGSAPDPLLHEAASEGIELRGSLRRLLRPRRSRA